LDLKPFDFWRLLSSFLKFDPQMPLSLVSHFREIELRIVTEQAWTLDSPLLAHIEAIKQHPEQSDDAMMQPVNMFFKRVITVTAEKVQDLCEHLKLEPSVVEKVWTVMKMQLSSEPQLLVNRQLDQMIMCAIYGVCKV